MIKGSNKDPFLEELVAQVDTPRTDAFYIVNTLVNPMHAGRVLGPLTKEGLDLKRDEHIEAARLMTPTESAQHLFAAYRYRDGIYERID